MKEFSNQNSNRSFTLLRQQHRSGTAGNVLIYVVVLMLIFGTLGVAMVSLFSSSTASTTTSNDTRRARYLSEAGIRYAIGELRRADFDDDIIINTLNTLTYTVSGAGSFELNIFSPWFDSIAGFDSPDIISLTPHFGEVPADFITDPASPPIGVWVVNNDFITGTNPDITTMRDDVISYSIDISGNLNIDISDDFVARPEDQIAFAAEPFQSQLNLVEGDDLDVVLDARLFFPRFNGAVTINRVDYAYERLVIDEVNNKVTLKNLTASQFPNTLPAFPLNVDAGSGGIFDGDFVILSPDRNYKVIAEGTSGSVIWGNAYELGMNLHDHSYLPADRRKADITAEDFVTNLSEQESDTRFFETNMTDFELDIGGGGTDEFGSAFFDATLNIGGERDYCQQGACLFAQGIRAFFLVNFASQGDGITFTLLNASGIDASFRPLNFATSAGGDFELSELMGYAGDSRLDAAGTAFLDSDPNNPGLDPPKIAVEFDTRTNNRIDDPPPDYCVGANVEANLRNDPLTADKDAVQYVFWGRENFLNIPCRGNSPLYDDNRHDADGEEPTEEWRFGTGGPVSVWYPAIGRDGTIYISDQNATLYALNEDGSVQWTFNLTDGNDYMPGIDLSGGPNDGTIYSDISGNSLVAINPDGTQKWRAAVGSDIDSTPTVGPDGVIYFGTDSAELVALNPNGTEKWRFTTGGEVDNVAALSPDASIVYFVSNDANLYALNTVDGTERWRFPIAIEPNELQSSPIVKQSDGTIYVGSDDQYVYALKEVARLADPTGVGGVNAAQGEWRFRTNGEIESSAAIDPVDGTIYIGSDDGNVWAINPNGTEKWRFPAAVSEVESSPIVDLDRTIYVGSPNGNIYAINPDGTQKWFFATGGAVPSSPAIGQDGFIHIGSDDRNFYTISQYGDPRNFKDEDKSAGKLLTVEDLDSSVVVDSNTDWLNGAGSRGPFAVRLEVDRALLPNVDGEFNYELRLWIRQCNNDLNCDNILGTFFEDTRIAYDYTAVTELPMRQNFSLEGIDHDAFERFFFGFTGAAGAEALDVNISAFQLSFIRPGDPVVDCDRNSWPLEDSPPLPDCVPLL